MKIRGFKKGIHVHFTNVDDNGMTARVIDQTALKRNMLSNEPNVILYTFSFYAFK